MPRRVTHIVFMALGLLYMAAVAVAQTPPQSHRDLDWNAPRRWVHVDIVLDDKAALFESARLEWLSALRVGDSLRGDGRPLFWHAKEDSVQTYFTFYPFRAMADLDDRVRMRLATDQSIGKEPGERYDRGDAGLISPHYSQVWRRIEADDIVWAGTEHLTELTAGVGRLDIHMPDLQRAGEVDSLWQVIRTTLATHEYPLACRSYGSLFGLGESILLWLAPDSSGYRSAPSIESALAKEFGEEKGRTLFAQFVEVFPVQRSYEVVRRADLSNLGR